MPDNFLQHTGSAFVNTTRLCLCSIKHVLLHHLTLRVGGKYRLGKKIGSGSCGTIYLRINIISGDDVAVNLKSVKPEDRPLECGSKVYQTLAGECDYSAMVVDLLGPSLEELFNFCHRKFSLTTLLMADQLVSRKPNLTGTARCTSITTHLSVEQARRDDLESHAYIVMCFLRGSLPFYTHVLRFNDKPDYSYLRRLFHDILAREGYQYDYVFGRSRQRAARNAQRATDQGGLCVNGRVDH
ncbi:hypothetical protein K466DRAFT_628672 [Polyporus arcularius HHB13444]|uniref:Non-specific serine/threonine protein kinase n=1 Tax=Polyporus arcularius HHB13444 TaxID=1314778 RepID=A0A5C3PB25_9APHY|nr:hypothetical protein K466DRAFT_628672 [Polyporus arcularius HHB13444]